MPSVKFGKYQHYKGNFYEVISVTDRGEAENFCTLLRCPRRAAVEKTKMGRNIHCPLT